MTMPIEPTETSGQDIEQEPAEVNINPAWNDVLSVIPASLHSQVTPHLAKWDEGVQTRISEANARYQGWDAFVENGVNPEVAANALQLAHSIRNDPRAFYDQMGEYYKFTKAEEKAIREAVEDGDEIPNPNNDPRIDALNERLDLVSRILVDEHQKRQTSAREAEEDRLLATSLDALKAQLGDKYDEDVILDAMGGFSDPAKAWEFLQKVSGVTAETKQPEPFAPRVLGSGGQIPTVGNKHPSKLSPDETEQIMAEMLMINNRSRRT